jgi:hypothetical protein
MLDDSGGGCGIARRVYFGFGLRLKLIALQPQRSVSGTARGVICIQDSQASHRKQARSALNAATTCWKSFAFAVLLITHPIRPLAPVSGALDHGSYEGGGGEFERNRVP